MSSRLPRELFDIIVDELRADISSLLACAQSFRAMVPSAQAQLFYKVVLHQPAPSNNGRKRPSHCQKLSGLLESSPHIASLIKDLRIVDDDPLLNTWVVNEARTLARVLPLLDLKRISVRCTTASLDWDSMHRGLKTSLQSVFVSPRLESIQLHGILISAPPECALFHIFMDSHANLQHLSFSYRLRRHRDRSLFIPPVWEPKLRSLVIDANHVIDILHGLSSSAMDYSRLRTLTLSGFIDSEIGELLTAIKGRNVLEDLNIYYPNSENSDTGLVGLKFLTNLRTIHFRTFCSFLPHELETVVRSCAENASLEKVVLELFVHNAHYYQESDWTALAMAAKDLNKPVEVLLGEFGAKDPRPWRLEVCIAGCFTAAEEALAIPSSGLTIAQSTSHNYIPLAEIYDGW